MYMNPNPAWGFAFLFGLGGLGWAAAFTLDKNYVAGAISFVVTVLVVWPFARAGIDQQRWIKKEQRERELGR